MTMNTIEPQQTAENGRSRMTNLVENNVKESSETLYRDGIVALKGAFSREWAEQMREDMMTAFWDAIQRPGGAIGRGPRRWYVEIHPQQMRGFVDLVTHPWIVAMSKAVLGPDYQIVEIGFDVPFQGGKNQPWHRDFPSPRDTYEDRRITSLAFNLTGVDVTPDMGPFEIAPGTQWDDGRAWKHEMFPPEELWPRVQSGAVRKFPQMGDVSCRSALTIHRGTAHGSPIARPVLVLGVDAPGAGHAALHDLMVTQDYYDALPPSVREHLVCRVVDKLVPVTQKHDIEGLVMGVD
jgi:hypothetical protein